MRRWMFGSGAGVLLLLAATGCGSAETSEEGSNGPGGGKADDAGGSMDGAAVQWLRLAGPGEDAGLGEVAGQPYYAFRTWDELSAAKKTLIASHEEANPVGVEWFDNESHGFAGLPYVLLRAMPHLAPEIFGKPQDQFSRFGFVPDDRWGKPVPLGLGYKTVALCPAPLEQLPNSPRCNAPEGTALPQINKATLTCASCHTGQVEVAPGEYETLRGATNVVFDVRAWRFAFDQLTEQYTTGEFENLLDDSKVTLEQLQSLEAELDVAIADAAAAGLYDGFERPASPLPEAAELAVYGAPVDAPGGDGTIKLGTVMFRETLKGSTARAQVLGILKQRAYSGEGKPGFDFGYPGSTDAAGEALVLVSALFGHELGVAPEDVPAEISDAPGMVDFMQVFNQGHRPDSNWDNVVDAPAARTQTAQLATTGVVEQLDLQSTSLLTSVLEALPPPAYPFEVDGELASRGREVFDDHCVACHHPGNTQRYGQVGTDLNRYSQFNAFTWEATTLALRAACPPGTEVDALGEGNPNPCDFDIEDILTDTPDFTGDDKGYGATALPGVWTSGPYLHNGSVPTVLELLSPQHRRDKYVRGSLSLDRDRIGFSDARDAGVDARIVRGWAGTMSEEELFGRFTYDTSLDGLSNAGHDQNVVLDGKELRLDWSAEVDSYEGGPVARAGSDLEALLEYVKTL